MELIKGKMVGTLKLVVRHLEIYGPSEKLNGEG